MHHYVTVYCEDGQLYAESWLQINAFGKRFCLWRKRVEVTVTKIDGVDRVIMG